MNCSKLSVVLFGCVTWLSVGCIADTTDLTVEPDVAFEALLGDEVVQRNGAYRATVSLEGSGCPSGSYNVLFDGDYTYTFDPELGWLEHGTYG